MGSVCTKGCDEETEETEEISNKLSKYGLYIRETLRLNWQNKLHMQHYHIRTGESLARTTSSLRRPAPTPPTASPPPQCPHRTP